MPVFASDDFNGGIYAAELRVVGDQVERWPQRGALAGLATDGGSDG